MAYDISIIRPQVSMDDIKFRNRALPAKTLKGIKKALLSLHCVEMTATNIYRYQISKEDSELNRQLIAAMCNEMGHYQDFQVKLFEYGWRPTILRMGYWLTGFFIGFGSRVMGKKSILKAGIWVETKAVKAYAQLLKDVDWDDETRRVIEKNAADEDGHIERWQKLLSEIK